MEIVSYQLKTFDSIVVANAVLHKYLHKRSVVDTTDCSQNCIFLVVNGFHTIFFHFEKRRMELIVKSSHEIQILKEVDCSQDKSKKFANLRSRTN